MDSTRLTHGIVMEAMTAHGLRACFSCLEYDGQKTLTMANPGRVRRLVGMTKLTLEPLAPIRQACPDTRTCASIDRQRSGGNEIGACT